MERNPFQPPILTPFQDSHHIDMPPALIVGNKPHDIVDVGNNGNYTGIRSRNIEFDPVEIFGTPSHFIEMPPLEITVPKPDTLANEPLAAPPLRANLPSPSSETKTQHSTPKAEVTPNTPIDRNVLEKPSNEQNKVKTEHWSANSEDSDEFRRGVAAMIENVPGDSPIEREVNLYNILPKNKSGALTPKSRKIWLGAWEYTHDKTEQFIVDETISNVMSGIGGFVLERALLTLGSALASALIKRTIKVGIEDLAKIAKLWHPIASRMRTLAVMRTDKGFYYATRGGSLTPTQREILKTLGFKSAKEELQALGLKAVVAEGHAEAQLINLILAKREKPMILFISKSACGKSCHRCSQIIDFITSHGFVGELDPSGMAMSFNPMK